MKINSIDRTFYLSTKYSKQGFSVDNNTPINNRNIDNLPNTSLLEAIGKSQLNFKGKNLKSFNLQKEDLFFLQEIGNKYKLKKNQLNDIINLTKDLLIKIKEKSLFTMDHESNANMHSVGRYLEDISDIADLKMEEEMYFVPWACIELNQPPKRIIDSFDKEKYRKDLHIFENFLLNQGLDIPTMAIVTLYFIDFKGLQNSVFDNFNEQNIIFGKLHLQNALNEVTLAGGEDFSEEKINNLVLELHNIAKNPQKDSKEKNSISPSNYMPIVRAICSKIEQASFKSVIKMLNQSNSPEEFAYLLAEKYDLPSGATKEILDIIKVVEDKSKSKK